MNRGRFYGGVGGPYLPSPAGGKDLGGILQGFTHRVFERITLCALCPCLQDTTHMGLVQREFGLRS